MDDEKMKGLSGLLKGTQEMCGKCDYFFQGPVKHLIMSSTLSSLRTCDIQTIIMTTKRLNMLDKYPLYVIGLCMDIGELQSCKYHILHQSNFL